MPVASSAEEKGYLDGVKPETADPVEVVENLDTQDAKPVAESSTADDKTTDAKEPTSMLEAVKNAAEKPAEAESPSDSESEGDPDSKEPDPAEAEAEGEGEGDEEADSKLPFHKHPRWQEVKAERDRYKDGHERFQALSAYVDEAGLSSEEVNQGFAIMRMMKHEPEKALEALTPFLDNIKMFTGAKLPEDIKKQVDEGYISEDLASELASRRAREGAQADAAKTAKADADRRLAGDVASAVSKWESDWASKDADYKRKAPRVLEKIENHALKHGLPASKEAAVKMAEDCRLAVDKELVAFMPRRGSVIPPAGGTATPSAPAPTTMLEAIKQAAQATSG